MPLEGTILVSIADRDKEESLPVLTGLAKRGFTFLATRGTADFLKKTACTRRTVYKIGEGLPDVLKAIKQGRVGMVVNTPTRGKTPARTGFAIRRAAVEYGVPCFTSLDTLQAVLYALQTRGTKEWQVKSLTDYQEIREELKP